MRFPRVRFTVRRMMVAVAIVAVATAMGVTLYRRSQRFRGIAAAFVLKEDLATVVPSVSPDEVRETYRPGASYWEVRVVAKPKNAAYYTQMRMKYERYSRYPWLLVTPDPPEPE
jgi:hypothetical protein